MAQAEAAALGWGCRWDHLMVTVCDASECLRNAAMPANSIASCAEDSSAAGVALDSIFKCSMLS